ncbi:fungal-specific transcription factor domain-containing protein [Thelonectria olida]|uniref:Fungal-specific transcription factor domain-containing protein n=1 Tax=Thelonectria olida TaxID=1576542 RepID=A0A9P9APD8_9HYPO|nr:fungal-specific transcription factor domain-containing protein [Thelonectria olida]
MSAKRLQEGPGQMKCRSKSRAGCRTCKMKRLKCDEAIPECRNCVARGVGCPGYRKDLKWSTKYETRRASITTGPLEFNALVSAASKSIGSDVHGPSSSQQTTKPCIVRRGSRSAQPSNVEVLINNGDPSILNTNDPCDADNNAIDRQRVNSLPLHEDRDTSLSLDPCQALTLPSTTLVELWFKSVCGVWSAFDSPSNPFRRLCSYLWTSSEVVFYSLQSMAGTSQPAATINSPGARETATMAPRLANKALIRELQALFEAPSSVSSVPSGLLISLFCMSSSCSWVDSRELGLQYLGNARLVLDLLELNIHLLRREDRELLEFFRGCLIYEQMLRGIVSDRKDDLNVLLEWNTENPKSDPFALHSWTGVSTTIVMLLGKSMALCRKSRHIWRHRPVATYNVMFQALLDIEEGQRLEERLLSIDASTHLQEANARANGSSIQLDLYNATEAFRLSALLQLYQSFPDLLSRRLPCQDDMHDESAQSQWVTGLAIRISEILENIPATSSMRCLQPLLCICAGSGLRHETPAPPEAPRSETRHITDSEDGMASLEKEEACIETEMEDVTASVQRARAFLLSRLGELDQGILSNSAIIAQQLLTAIWTAFDRDEPPHRSHWMDIMSSSKAWTVFG